MLKKLLQIGCLGLALIMGMGCSQAQEPAEPAEVAEPIQTAPVVETLPDYIKPYIVEGTCAVLEIRLENVDVLTETEKFLQLFQQDDTFPRDTFGQEIRMREQILENVQKIDKQRQDLLQNGIHSVVLFVNVMDGVEQILFVSENLSGNSVQMLKENYSGALTGTTSHGFSVLFSEFTKDSAEVPASASQQERFDWAIDRDPIDPKRFAAGWKLLTGMDVKLVAALPSVEAEFGDAADTGALRWFQNLDKSLLAFAFGVNWEADEALGYAVFKDEKSAKQILDMTPSALESITRYTFQERNFHVFFAVNTLSMAFHFLEPRQQGNLWTVRWSDVLKKWESFNSPEAEAAIDSEAEADRLAKLIEPWTTNSTTFVLHTDLERVSAAGLSESLTENLEKYVPHLLSWQNEISDFAAGMEILLDALAQKQIQLRAAGAKDLFVLCDLMEPEPYIIFLIPLKQSEARKLPALMNCDALLEALPEGFRYEFGALDFFEAGIRENALYFAMMDSGPEGGHSFTEWMDRDVMPRSQFRDGFALCADDGVKLIFAMNPRIQRDVLPEFLEFFFKQELLGDFPDVTVPSDRVVARGLDVMTLSFSDQTGAPRMNLLAKTDVAATNFVRAFNRLKQEISTSNVWSYCGDFMTQGTVDLLLDNIVLKTSHRRMTPCFTMRENLRAAEPGDFRFLSAAAGVICGYQPGLNRRDIENSAQYKYNAFHAVQMALLAYVYNHDCFPPLYSVDEDGKPLHSWRVLILPYLESKYAWEQKEIDELRDKIRFNEPWDSKWNQQFHDKCPGILKNSAVVAGEGLIFDPSKVTRGVYLDEIADGTSNTLLTFFAMYSDTVHWMDPQDFFTPEDLTNALSDPGTITNAVTSATLVEDAWLVGKADGECGMFSTNVDPEDFNHLLLRRDGMVASIPWQWQGGLKHPWEVPKEVPARAAEEYYPAPEEAPAEEAAPEEAAPEEAAPVVEEAAPVEEPAPAVEEYYPAAEEAAPAAE